MTLAQRKRQGRAQRGPMGGELGFGGVRQFQGFVNEEYLVDLQGSKWFDAIDRMRRSDGMISAIEQVITLPIRSAAWRIDTPGNGATGALNEAAEALEANLFGGMTITWDDLLRQLLLSAFYGFCFAEKVFEERDGRIAWRKIAPRKPSTRFRWIFGEHGAVEAVIQAGYAPRGWTITEPIPIEKLLLMTFRGEFGNPEGFSLLRPAYKHWLMRDAMYQKYNMGVDKDLLPILLGRVPERDMGTARASLFEQSLQSVYSSSGAYFLLPSKRGGEASEGYDLSTVPTSGKFMGLLEMAEHHGREMARSVLAQFLTLGQDSGAYALSADQSDFFLMSENALVRQICDLFNAYAIPQLCEYNWPGLPEYPQLACEAISGVDIDKVATALSDLAAAGFVQPGVHDEEAMRSMLHLPEIPEEQVKKREELEAEAALNPAMDPVTGNPVLPGKRPNLPPQPNQPIADTQDGGEARQSAIERSREQRRAARQGKANPNANANPNPNANPS